MVFQVPASKASRGQDKFEFQIGEDMFSVRKMKYVPIETLEQVQDNGSAGLTFFSGSTKKQATAVRSLETEQFQALVQAWSDDSGLTPGESPASAS